MLKSLAIVVPVALSLTGCVVEKEYTVLYRNVHPPSSLTETIPPPKKTKKEFFIQMTTKEKLFDMAKYSIRLEGVNAKLNNRLIAIDSWSSKMDENLSMDGNLSTKK